MFYFCFLMFYVCSYVCMCVCIFVSDGMIIYLWLYMCFFSFEDDFELMKFFLMNGDGMVKLKYNINGMKMSEFGIESVESKLFVIISSGKLLKVKVLFSVFFEDFESVKKKILDFRGSVIRRWNKIFLVVCLVFLFVDFLFFYLLMVKKDVCIDIGMFFEVIFIMVSLLVDVFYMV